LVISDSAGPALRRAELVDRRILVAPTVARRAFDAMMTMQKIDVAAIKAAVRG
jgi:hypothetical protein